MGQEASDPATEPTPAAPAEAEADQENNDGSEPGCPICQFLEAGPCGDEHKVWVACREEAKNDGVDFVQHCGDLFRTFFGCMLAHQGYYQPFLEAFEVDVDGSQKAIDSAKDRDQQPDEQQQQHAADSGEAAEHEKHGSRRQQASSEGPAQQQQQQQASAAVQQHHGSSASTGAWVGSIAPAAQ